MIARRTMVLGGAGAIAAIAAMRWGSATDAARSDGGVGHDGAGSSRLGLHRTAPDMGRPPPGGIGGGRRRFSSGGSS